MKRLAQTRLAVRVARGQEAQQAAIDAWLGEHASCAATAECAVLAQGAFFELAVPAQVILERLGAGCVCCVGLLPLQVTLTRLLRIRRPGAVLLLLNDASHLERVHDLVASGKLGVSLEQP
jgi:hypothetical protein